MAKETLIDLSQGPNPLPKVGDTVAFVQPGNRIVQGKVATVDGKSEGRAVTIEGVTSRDKKPLRVVYRPKAALAGNTWHWAIVLACLVIALAVPALAALPTYHTFSGYGNTSAGATVMMPADPNSQIRVVTALFTSGEVALNYWLEKANDQAAAEQSAWVINLDADRRFIGCEALAWRFYAQPILFADEVLSAAKKCGAAEVIVLHNRPRIAPRTVLTESKARARAIILAASSSKCSLLDYILRGDKNEKYRLGIFSLRHLRSFHADDPFPPRAKKQKEKIA